MHKINWEQMLQQKVLDNDASKVDLDPPVAYAEFDRFLSQLDNVHLKDMAAEIKGQYVKAEDKPEFYDFVQPQSPVAKFVTAYSVRWLFLIIAVLLVLATYTPHIYGSYFNKKAIRKMSA